MVLNGKVTMIKATGKGLIAEIETEECGACCGQIIWVNCPREPRELDVDDDVAVTISKRCGEGASDNT